MRLLKLNEASMDARNGNGMLGTIKHFNLAKGWGFVQTETQDYFFHVTNFTRTGAVGEKPRVGERVTFEVAKASAPGKKNEAYSLRPFHAGLATLAKGLGGDDERA